MTTALKIASFTPNLMELLDILHDNGIMYTPNQIINGNMVIDLGDSMLCVKGNIIVIES